MRKSVLICLISMVCLIVCCGLCRTVLAQNHTVVTGTLSSEANTNIIQIPVGYSAIGATVAVFSAGDQPGLLTVLIGRSVANLPLESGSQTQIILEHEQGGLPVTAMTDNALAEYEVNVEVECVRQAK